MSILCKWFGHKLPKGWCNGAPYLKRDGGAIDGMGTEHVFLYAECDRCGEEYNAANFHMPKGVYLPERNRS